MATLFAGPGTVKEETELRFTELKMPEMSTINAASNSPLIVAGMAVSELLRAMRQLPGGDTEAANNIVAFRNAQREQIMSQLPETLKPSEV